MSKTENQRFASIAAVPLAWRFLNHPATRERGALSLEAANWIIDRAQELADSGEAENFPIAKARAGAEYAANHKISRGLWVVKGRKQ